MEIKDRIKLLNSVMIKEEDISEFDGTNQHYANSFNDYIKSAIFYLKALELGGIE